MAGLRLRLLLLLGGLMVLAFVPLHFATATYVRVALRQQQEAHARALGRSIATHTLEARQHRSPDQLLAFLESELSSQRVDALALYDAQGAPTARVGDPALVRALEHLPAPQHRPLEPTLVPFRGPRGAALAVYVTEPNGSVAAIFRVDADRTPAARLIRLVSLYTALAALATLLGAYIALTRLIVRPIDALSRAAQRVADGARELSTPRRAPYEIDALGKSLRTMTARLVAEEQALRHKVDEVERATEQMRAAQETLVRSERLASVGRLAAGLAHEIGNPISALLGLQDLLLEGGLSDAEQRDFLERMKRETTRVHRILRDLLEFARPAAPRSPLSAPGDVATAVADTLALVRPQRALRDLRLLDELAPQLPLVALGHEELVQVLLNLVMNAADACERRGHIHITAQRGADHVLLTVSDDGPGVPAAVRERLFEPFVTTKEVGKGTGLGLAVSRGLVEGCGGTLRLDDSHSAGARFVIELPFARH